MSASLPPAPHLRRRPLSGLGVGAIGALGFFAYFVLIGGTAFGELVPVLHLVNGAVAAVLIVAFVGGLARADRVDAGVVGALALFAFAALFSTFLRQSFDAVLGALGFAAAFFVGRDLLARPPVRRLFPYVLIALSTVVTAAIGLDWISRALEWWSLTGWTVAPPLGFELSGGRWGHRHDAALLVALLYPAWWTGTPSVLRRVTAFAMALVVAAVVVLGGSRALWLTFVIASLVVFGPLALRHWPRGRPSVAVAFVGIGVVAVTVLTGLAGTIISRAGNLATFEYRSAMWGTLVDAWLDEPITGFGPGSFPWVLQTTDYFDNNSWAPRHPDSAIFQVLPEAGLLGLAAMIVLVVVIVPAVLRSPSIAARWTVVSFAVACLAANPSSFAFLVAVAVGWTAFALPRPTADDRKRPLARVGWPRPARGASFAALTIIGLAYLSTIIGGFHYSAAVEVVERDAIGDAGDRLDDAIALDPGMALYHRQRAMAYLADGDPGGAAQRVRSAMAINPYDDLSWRILAVANLGTQDIAAARHAIERALDLQRSDPGNLLLAAYLAVEAGDDTAAVGALAEAVHAWPAVVVAPGWADLVSRTSADTDALVRMAASREAAGVSAPDGNPELLAALAGEPVVGDEAASELLVASYRCDSAVERLLERASPALVRAVPYWEVRVRESFRRGNRDDTAIRSLEILTGRPLPAESGTSSLDPLRQYDEPVPWGSDIWGYRRVLISWPPSDIELPLPRAAEATMLVDPSGAAADAGIAECVPGTR